MSKEAKRAIYILVFGNFLICLGISLVIPVEPYIKKSYGFSTTEIGIMTSLFAFAQFVASPITGRVSDKIGRKKVIVTGLLLYMVAEAIFAMSNSLWLFDISRIIGGLAAAMFVPTSMAMAADLTDDKQRARVVGWISAAFSGGLILGPGIGGMLAHITYKVPFWAAAILGLLSTIITQWLLPDEPAKDIQAMPKINWRQFLTPLLTILFAMIFISSFGLQGFESIYSIYVNQVFNFGMGTIALVLTLNGVISLFFQIVMFDWLTKVLGELKLIALCFLGGSLSTIWITQTRNHWQVIVATLIVFTAFDLLRPAITTLLTKMSHANQGLINGLNMSLTSVGNVVGPIMAGVLMDINPHSPYLLVAAILFLSFLISLIVQLVAIRQTK
ncbi:MFS transporter [Bombilactobacillus thymidiniphilus]|uniref:MFS transporter n=1 Tax=Bombilactobacillus thymidiniphilus TaxID=2923363 RepID=A0ABY4PE89_9LACO|nr:MFS transporter [Bombilactobacillus thymidiniphilus]UQS83880.1 MFS transporter [Bombilactobacillus thymidiniphilus]